MPRIAFGDGAPEDTLPEHLPELLAASREAVAAGTPVVLMSECTLVPPVLAAVREKHPDVALVWIDAHGDLNTPATTPSGFLGGMPFAQLLGWCFDDWRRQAGLEPALPEQRAVLVGGRDLDPGERDNVDRSQLQESDDAAGALAAFPGDAPLYVHVDTDVLDPSLTPDAGFPAPGGWSVERMRERARDARRERPRRRALGLPERASGARRRGPRAPRRRITLSACAAHDDHVADRRDERRQRDHEAEPDAARLEAPLDAVAARRDVDGAEEPVLLARRRCVAVHADRPARIRGGSASTSRPAGPAGVWITTRSGSRTTMRAASVRPGRLTRASGNALSSRTTTAFGVRSTTGIPGGTNFGPAT